MKTRRSWRNQDRLFISGKSERPAGKQVMKMLERDIQAAIIQYAQTRGLSIFRRNVGGAKFNGVRFVRFAVKGQSDLYGWTRDGHHFEIECKAPGKKPSPEQKQWLEQCRRSGALAGWFNNIDDAIKFLGAL